MRALLILAALLLGFGCSDATAPDIDVFGGYRLVSVNAQPLPSLGYHAGRLTLRRDWRFEHELQRELAPGAGASVVWMDGSYSRQGRLILLQYCCPEVVRAELDGNRLTLRTGSVVSEYDRVDDEMPALVPPWQYVGK